MYMSVNSRFNFMRKQITAICYVAEFSLERSHYLITIAISINV